MEGEEAPQIQKEISRFFLGFVDTMTLKCALELGIPDIIHSHRSPMSLSQIVDQIGSPSLDLVHLSRVMRLLVCKNVFSASTVFGDPSQEVVYGLTPFSRLLLQSGTEMTTLAPVLFMSTHPLMYDSWQHMSGAIKDCVSVFEKAHGCSLWELTSKNPELNKLFNSSMKSLTKFNSEIFLKQYKDGFQGIETLVDVGGGTGHLVSEVVKANWPRIKGINFDLQHVVETAPAYPGVTHVGGNMFSSIPHADAIMMKSVLHNWDDEDCQKILQNCKTTLSNKAGKLILVEVVNPIGQKMDLDDENILKLDLVMMVYFGGGKERTQIQWIDVLQKAGFSQVKFIKTSTTYSIIETYAS